MIMDRRWLFLGSVLIVILSLVYSGWLVASGQANDVDGLFLLLSCLLLALAFALYLLFLINRAQEELQPPAKGPAKQPAAAD